MQTATIDLKKGDKIDLTKGTGLAILCCGLGWDVKAGAGDAFDLDATMIALRGGKFSGNQDDILFFNSNKKDGSWVDGTKPFPYIMGGAMVHSGDNRTGVGEGDDETLTVDFSKLPPDVTEVLVFINIFEAQKNGYNFGQVNGAFCRLYNKETNTEIAKYDLNEDYSSFNGILMARLYIHEKDGVKDWKVQAMGEGKNGSIADIAATLPK